MRSSRFQVLAVAAMMFVASVVVAQEGGRGGQGGRGRGGQGGQGGQGGFGGGFQPGRGGPGGFGGFGGRGGGIVGLLQDPKVQTEIELLDEQKVDIQKVAEAARESRGNLFGGGGERPDFQNMSDEERQKFFAEMQERAAKAEKELRGKIAEVLLPHQMERLDQLSLQQRGVGALMDPEVGAKLKITDDQRKQMTSIQEEMTNKMRESARELFQGGGNREEAMRKLGEMRQEVEKKVLNVLTDGQQKSFAQMKGKPFEFSPPQPRGGFGGPGGAGGGNRPQRPEGDR